MECALNVTVISLLYIKYIIKEREKEDKIQNKGNIEKKQLKTKEKPQSMPYHNFFWSCFQNVQSSFYYNSVFHKYLRTSNHSYNLQIKMELLISTTRHRYNLRGKI